MSNFTKKTSALAKQVSLLNTGNVDPDEIIKFNTDFQSES